MASNGEGQPAGSSGRPDGSSPLGTYGLRVAGIPAAAQHLTPADASWPALAVQRLPGIQPPSDTEDIVIAPDRADLLLSDGTSRSAIDRASGTAVLSLTEAYTDEALLHPMLSGTCAVLNWWHGRDTLHAGALVVEGRAWGVLGAKGQGKSTLLGHLASVGVPVLSDDMLVDDGGVVLAGPGFVDLRSDAAAALGIGRDLGMLGRRHRARFDLPARPASAPLAGWVSLAWAEGTELRTVDLRERLHLLMSNRAVLLEPRDPAGFLRRSALPFYEFRRPRAWDTLASSAQALVDLLAGAAR